MTTASAQTDETGATAEAALRRRIAYFIVAMIAMALLYSALSTSSEGICVGGGSAESGWLDGDGRPTDAAPTCVNVTFGPTACCGP